MWGEFGGKIVYFGTRQIRDLLRSIGAVVENRVKL